MHSPFNVVIESLHCVTKNSNSYTLSKVCMTSRDGLPHSIMTILKHSIANIMCIKQNK